MYTPRLLRDAPDSLSAAPYDRAHHVRLHQDPQREVYLAAGRVPHRAGQATAAAAANAHSAEPLLVEEMMRGLPPLLQEHYKITILD